MARVPSVDGPQLRSAPLSGGELRAPDTSSARRAVASIESTIDREIERRDNDVALRTEAEIKTGYLQFEAELRKQSQGRNAEGYTAKVQKWWDDTAKEAAGRLTPQQQRIVSRSLQAARLQAGETALRYQNAELDRSEAESFQAAQLAEVQRGAASGNPAAAAVSSELLKQRNAEWAQRKGWTPEQLADANMRATTALHVNLLQSLRQADPAGAQAYFAANKKEIDGTRHAEIEQQLKIAASADKAQKVGAQLARQFDFTQTAQAQAAIDALDATAEEKKAIRAEVEHRHAIRQADADKADALVRGRLSEMVERGMSVAAIQKTPEFASVRDKGAVLSAVRRRVQELVNIQAAAESRDYTKTQRLRAEQEYKGMVARFAYEDPAVLTAMTRPQVAALALELGPHNAAHILQRYDALGGNPAKLREAKIDHDQFNTIAATLGIDAFSPKTDDQKAQVSTLRDRVNGAIDIWQRAHGNQEMPRDQKEKLMRDLIAQEVITRGRFWGSNKTNTGMVPEKDLERIVVPEEAAKLIQEAYARATIRAQRGDAAYQPTPEELAAVPPAPASQVGRAYLRQKQREAAGVQ